MASATTDLRLSFQFTLVLTVSIPTEGWPGWVYLGGRYGRHPGTNGFDMQCIILPPEVFRDAERCLEVTSKICKQGPEPSQRELKTHTRTPAGTSNLFAPQRHFNHFLDPLTQTKQYDQCIYISYPCPSKRQVQGRRSLVVTDICQVRASCQRPPVTRWESNSSVLSI